MLPEAGSIRWKRFNMKRIFFLLFALALTFPALADTEGRAKFVVTGIPNDGDTLTYRGNVRTWKTIVGSSATQIQIGASAVISANNLMTALGQYPFDTASHIAQFNTTNITVIADANLTVTASVAGSWGTVTVTATTLTQRGIALPFATESTTTRTNDANDIILAFNYASQAFGASVAALSNYVATTTAQNIPGAKNFTGVNVSSNSLQQFIGGYLSNITRADIGTFYLNTQGYFLGGIRLTNETPNIDSWDADASANNRRTQVWLDQSGFLVKYLNDAGSSSSNVFEITKDATSGFGSSGAIFRTRLTADYIYNTILSNSVTTNMVMLHSAAALIANLMATGPLAISNTAPILTLNETDAGTDLKQFQFRSEAGHLILYMATDAGAVASNQKLWEVERPGLSALTTDSLFRFKGPVQFDSTAAFTGADITVSGIVRSGTGVLIGSTLASMPQTSGIYSIDGSGPIADPTTGFSIWSAGAGMKYRTSVASEGAGQENFVHNRTGSTLGAGTDYTLTGSTAFVDFGTTDPKVTLPTDGTYLIWADVAVTAGGTANDDYRFKLRNETTSTDLSGSDQEITYLGAAQLGSVKMQTTTTASASNVIAVWGFNNTAARGTVNSARTRIGYVRLY